MFFVARIFFCGMKSQKRGPLKDSEVPKDKLERQIVDFIISLFVLELKPSNLYSRIFKSLPRNDFS